MFDLFLQKNLPKLGVSGAALKENPHLIREVLQQLEGLSLQAL
jgi:hypothetical protein